MGGQGLERRHNTLLTGVHADLPKNFKTCRIVPLFSTSDTECL